jgi:hypothetical protein
MNACRVWVGKREGKRTVGRPRHKWEANIMTNLKEIRWDCMDWNDLDQDRDQWRSLVNAVMYIKVS